MPELPEVEVTRRGLLPHLPNRKIIDVWWSGKHLRSSMPIELLQKTLLQNFFVTIDRRAKYLLCRLTDGAVLVIHLGMTGKVSVVPRTTPRKKHDHIGIELDDAKELRLNDSRRFGNIEIWPAELAKKKETALSNNEGIEPLSSEFTSKLLYKLALKRTTAIKTFLMNGKIIAGIGNIYANEILFTTGIHPETTANKISKKQWEEIAKASTKILNRAIKVGGTTISDFLSSSGQPGYFQLELNVYGKKDEPCTQCGTKIIKQKLAGRSAFFCPTCQPKKRTPWGSQKNDTPTG